jgi:glycosyltransferase involved in cell wall biosynthesis
LTSRPTTFSIVIPAYNSKATIGSAIESVQRQSRADFELIIVDDGSTDDTASRVEPFLRDERIRLISQRNLGVAAALNRGIGSARGQYISFLGSDDLWLPHYLAAMAATLDGDPTAAVAYTDAWILDEGTRRIRRVTAMGAFHPPEAPRQPSEFFRSLLERGNYVFAGTTVRRWVFDKVGTFRADLHSAEDYELWLRIASRGYRFVRCPLKLAIYRQRPGQLSADTRSMLLRAAEVFQIVAEEYDVPEDVRELARRRMQEQERLSGSFTSIRLRRVPRRLMWTFNWLSRMRHFYLRPPREIREVFPNLHAL